MITKLLTHEVGNRFRDKSGAVVVLWFDCPMSQYKDYYCLINDNNFIISALEVE